MNRRVGRPTGTTGRAPVFTPAQIKTVMAAARGKERLAERTSAIFAMSIGLGLRAKELASIVWRDVFEATGEVRDVLHLKSAYTKGGKTRDVFLSSPALRKALERYWSASKPVQSDAPLFRSVKGGHLTPTSMARSLKRLYVDAGVPGASSHSGRRTLITRLAERGIDLKAISAIAGHASVRTTAIYVESNPSRLARILKDVSW